MGTTYDLGILLVLLSLMYAFSICSMYIYIYMFICSELIEETGRPPGLIFGMWGYCWPGSDKFESWEEIHTFDGVMT